MRSAEQGGDRLDAVVVGSGFSGLYMLYKLRERGLRAVVLEAGSDVGGTWYWNRYPGARCDVESVHYSYSFSEALDQDWTWSERYAAQPEILRYLQHVADRFDLRRDIRFDTRVAAAHFRAASNDWRVITEAGEAFTARFCIMATGCLSSVNRPDIPGADDFAGEVYHTGAWPHEGVDFQGKRVGILGTGSSASQAIPLVAQSAAQLTVFQRTANHCVPARNYPLSQAYVAEIKRRYPELRRRWRESPTGTNYFIGNRSAHEVTPQERELTYAYRWEAGGIPFQAAFDDLMVDAAANETAADFVRRKISQIVEDPDVARQLMPTRHPLGTKRICVVDGYYETFNRANVRLVSVRETPIERIETDGVRLAGEFIPLDVLIFATGFDAMTGALAAIDIQGRDGVRLREAWAHSPDTYLGLMVAGFPNLFLITGPGSPSVLSVVTMSIEQHVEWIDACLGYLQAHDIALIEAERAAQEAWVEHVNEVANQTLFPRAESWYTGANIEGKPRNFPIYIGGYQAYSAKLREVAEHAYDGFRLTPFLSRNAGDGDHAPTSSPAQAGEGDHAPKPAQAG